MGAGRELTCQGASNALQNWLEIDSHTSRNRQPEEERLSVLFSTPRTTTLPLALQLLGAYDEGITQECENSKATRGSASSYPCKQLLQLGHPPMVTQSYSLQAWVDLPLAGL